MTSLAAIVCAHTEDRWADINRAVDSLEAQTRSPNEIVLAIDNNEPLFERATDALSQRATVVHNTGRRGVSPTRNVAAASSVSDVLAYLDDDAVAAPGWLEAMEPWYDDLEVLGVGGLATPNWDGGSRPSWFPPSFYWVVGCSHSGVPLEAGPTRNFIGCNMSVRRHAWAAVGGFDDDMGRVGANGGGGDETDFCIRLVDSLGGTIIHEPAAVVTHRVPPSRQTLRYFAKRCYREGTSKGQITRRLGTDVGLSEERGHLTATLPREFLAGAKDVAVGQPSGATRSGAILIGTAATGIGFAASQGSRPAPPVEEPNFSPATVTTIDIADMVPNYGATERLFAVIRNGDKVLGVVRDDRTGTTEVEPTMDPSVSVVIATRNRTDSLERCLRSIVDGDRLPNQIVVVDNARSTDETERMVSNWNGRGEPPVTYVSTPRPGLAHAHNIAIPYVTSDVVAFTDDDVLADPRWLQQIVDAFNKHPQAACVTGGIMPAQLETWPQQWAEDSSSFNKGFEMQVFDSGKNRPDDPLFPYTAGSMGSGANMAFTTKWLRAQGGFNQALGAGTEAMGGDDLRAFYDVVRSGGQLVYNPDAVVFHHHHRTPEAIERQTYGYGAGLTAFLTSVIYDEPSALFRLLGRIPAAASRAREINHNAGGGFPLESNRTRQHRKGLLSGPALYRRSRKKSM